MMQSGSDITQKWTHIMWHLDKLYMQTDVYKWYIHWDIEGGTTRIGEETQPKKQVTTKVNSKDTRHTLTNNSNP